jgi:heme-degrading monooxygenase HmoA
MIARYWSARLPAQSLVLYKQHFSQHVIPQLKTVPGFVRAELLTRNSGNEFELIVLSIWESLDAIRAFAGADHEAAVVAPAAAALFTDYDRRVRHFEIKLSFQLQSA